MKTTTQATLYLFFLASLVARSQSTTELNTSQEPENSKSKYIQSQGYLSPNNNVVDYKSYYGDSLKGFDEARAKTEALNDQMFGAEFIYVMNVKKREYINNKYKIGYAFAPKPAPAVVAPAIINGKPIGGGNNINLAPCVNEDFELCTAGSIIGSNAYAIPGWTLDTQNNVSTNGSCLTNTSIPWNPGSQEAWVMQTPILAVPWIGNLPNSPLGGTKVIKLGDSNNGFTYIHRLSQTFPVTNANTLFQFAYAGSWDGSGHPCCSQPFFRINMYDCNGAPLTCASLSLTPSGPSCPSGAGGYSVTSNISWTNWSVKFIDLTPFVGTCVTIRFTSGDCSGAGHHGSIYLDARCGGQLIGNGLPGPGGGIPGAVSFCAGSNQAIIASPLGYSTYQWIAPGNNPIPAPQGTAPTLTVSNPVPNSCYTVVLNSASGCTFNAVNCLNTSTVMIAGILSNSTCPGGASGSATVWGNGSGTGYNYNWMNSSSVTIGTASTVTGLAPGVYSIVITGAGAAGCGTAMATVTINTAPQALIEIYKPYCNNEAYLYAGAGSNFHWYNNTTAIPPPLGIAPSYTATSPCSGCFYYLSYTSIYGCQDSIRFILGPSAPGVMTVSNIKLVCPGGSNSSAVVSLTPAPGAPPGQNTFSVFSIAQVTPTYTSALFPTAMFDFTPTGLSAGTYSVNVFDGSCKYGTSFVVQTLTYNYTVSPVTSTLCPGDAIAAGITFSTLPSPTQYSYSWSPATWLAGNTQQSTIIMPTTPPGVITTIVYTIVVTPTLANCPVTKTISVTAANPVVPSLIPVPRLCDVSTPFTVVATPGGGTFTAVSANLMGPSSGIISPTFAPLGVNSYTYAYNVFTCIATNTGTFEVSQFHTSALTGSVPNLCVTNNAFNLMNIVQSSVSGVWSGTGVQGNYVFNPQNLITGTYPITYSTTSSPNPTVCPSITNINVAVTKTVTPYITPVAEFCNNKAAFNMTVNIPGGGWSGNGVSNAGVVSPTVYSNPGTFNLTYTVADGPCVNINSTSLVVSRFITASLTASIPYLCVTNNPFNLLGICQNTNGIWAGTGVTNNALDPFGLPTGIYTYTYTHPSTPNFTLCPDTRTITANVLNPPAPNITQAGPYCNNGAPVQLSVSPNTGSWTPSPYLSNTGVFTPSLCPVGNNIVQYIIGTNTCNTTQTKVISIEAFVSAALTGAVPNLCNTNPPYNLQNTTQNNLGTWSGQGIQGQSFNPALSGAGVFMLSYNTLSSPSGLCPDQSTVAVTVYSLALPSVTKLGPFCNSKAPTQIMVDPIGGLFGGANNNAVTPQGVFNPPSAVIGDNIINYSITAGPCVAYAQTTITIEKFVSADFEKLPGPYCRNNTQVNMNSFVQNPGGTWSGPGISGNMFNPAIANIGSNNVITYTTHSMPTASLCPDTSAVRIRVNEMPDVKVAGNITEGCAPVEVLLNITNANTGSGYWYLGDGSDPKSGLNTSHIYTTPGTYTVIFSYEDEIGCKGQTQLPNPITVYELPKADFSAPMEVMISNPEVQFTNLSTVLTSNKYSWKVSGVPQSTEIHPLIKFEKIGRYPVTLQAMTMHGCKDEVSRTIEVKNEFNIFIPSSFSPNYDGLNDVFIPVFTPYGLDAKTYEMEIFDRWGHSLFYTKDVTKGWDGSVLNKGSEELKEEVFIYKIKYKDMDGNVYNKMGHVSLLK